MEDVLQYQFVQRLLHRDRQSILVNMLWTAMKLIGYFNCIFCSVVLSNLMTSFFDIVIPGTEAIQIPETPKEWSDKFTFFMNVLMCLVSIYYSSKLKKDRADMELDAVSSWIIAHFFVYQYYVLYDYSVYGYVGASYGSELFGCSFVFILASQMFIVMKIYEIMRL